MDFKRDIILSNGASMAVDSSDLDKTYQEFIDKFIKPFYQKSNDWNNTLKNSIKEAERISILLQVSRKEIILGLLKRLEPRLSEDIAELRGVDKIEILFESVEDYVENIQNIVETEPSQAEMRNKVSALVENLNLFEMAELLIYFSKKSLQ